MTTQPSWGAIKENAPAVLCVMAIVGAWGSSLAWLDHSIKEVGKEVQALTIVITANTERIQSNARAIDANTKAIDRLVERFDRFLERQP